MSENALGHMCAFKPKPPHLLRKPIWGANHTYAEQISVLKNLQTTA
eukprot:CAMPEP_0202384866 /NCGR_PEP_ID=MMETSP1127-20130417/57528_1 /ASSEMBLY_ACC=CAM_ASM_000462 /TAXON_ID=3047 /ORGANISM="Dunaliella tertiolecta, Strain CCMP1320" /LENGTH=45 /DNA_ID= /DNA_START= /DNA_END= /DNA_ORIENTATION=